MKRVERHFANFSVTSQRGAFLEKLLGSELFANMNPDVALRCLAQRKLSIEPNKQYGPLTPLTIIPLLRKLWEVEKQWYEEGGHRPAQSKLGLEYTAEIEIWESATYPAQNQKPKPIEGTELIPWKMSIVDTCSVQPWEHQEERDKGSNLNCYRGIKLFLHPFGLVDKRESIVKFLEDADRIEAVIKYFEQYYG